MILLALLFPTSYYMIRFNKKFLSYECLKKITYLKNSKLCLVPIFVNL